MTFKVGDKVRVKDCGIGGVEESTHGETAFVKRVYMDGLIAITMTSGEDTDKTYCAEDFELEPLAD